MRRTLAGMVAAAVLGTACAAATAPTQRSGVTTTPSPSASTIIIKPDRIWFDPPGVAQPKLTSFEALAVFEAADPEFQPSAEPVPQLGFYTAAVGDGTYRYKDRLAWGYSWHQCAVPFGQPPSGAVEPCTEWLFLDADTGLMLEATWQVGS